MLSQRLSILETGLCFFNDYDFDSDFLTSFSFDTFEDFL